MLFFIPAAVTTTGRPGIGGRTAEKSTGLALPKLNRPEGIAPPLVNNVELRINLPNHFIPILEKIRLNKGIGT